MPPALPPNPSLIAVLLVVDTRAGPRLVFHYPRNPRDDLPPTYSTSKTPEDTDSDDSDIGDLSSDDENSFGSLHFGRAAKSKRSRNFATEDENDSPDESTKPTAKGPAWETLFGFPTSALESILSPGRHFDRKKFELGLEPLVYVSYPVYVREDGHWRKKSQKKKRKYKGKDKPEGQAIDQKQEVETSGGSETEGFADDSVKHAKGEAPSLEDGVEALGLKHASDDDEDNSKSAKDAVADEDSKSMSMFNVVFVLKPPQLEYILRVSEMYENVAKRFSKALRYEQAHSNWVWNESELILNLQEKAKDDGTPMNSLWLQILTKSSLARTLSEVYSAISTSKIAHVLIGDRFDMSLQIPQVSSISVLPSVIEPQMPGVWLTTANMYDDDENVEDSQLAKHFSLLLLDDVDNILKDIEKDQGSLPLASSLAKFVKIVKPTMSFREISIAHNISLADIQVLSSHLIYWRRARAIPPLHQRNIYIVSPNCDMAALSDAIPAYAARFPTLPSLPKMLAALSGQGRQYRNFIPSKDHREAYLEILAWLMKGGWITQLRTFAWVRVPAEVKAGVAREERLAAGGFQAEVVPNPHQATAETAAWLAYMSRELFADMPELQEAWPRFLKYLTGKHALEKIAVREGIRPKEVWRLLGGMEVRGAIIVTRHW